MIAQMKIQTSEQSELKTYTAQRFSKAASQYRDHAKVQAKTAHYLFELLSEGEGVLLDLGAGPLLHQQSLRQFYKHILHMDLSHTMLMQGCGEQNRVCADMDNLPFQSSSIDAIFSNFAIQWSQAPDRLFSELARISKPGAKVVLSTVLSGSLEEIEIAWRKSDFGTHINRFLSFNQLLEFVEKSGFELHVAKQIPLIDEYPDAKSAMKSIKEIGANQLQNKRVKKGLMGKKAYQKVLNGYPLVDGRAHVTYQVALLELIKR